ncbi:MAG: DUF6542 domain-containing protein [Pseudonocardiaceae bacterium]
MTTARERPAAPRKLGWDESSLLPGHAGLRWWAAICLAMGFTAVGVFVDVQRLNRLGILFQACYFLGCLLAVTMVQRKGLFGPMVQAPLLLTLAVPSVVLLAGSVPTGGGTATAALAIGTPLINGFPTMAITTGVTLAIGFFRLFTQRPPAARNTPQPEGTPKPDRKRAAAPAPKPPADRVDEAAAEQVDRPHAAEPMTEPVPRVTDRVNPRRRRRS